MRSKIFFLLSFLVLSLQAKDVIVDFNSPQGFYKDCVFTKGLEGQALDLSAASTYRYPYIVEDIDSVDMTGSFTIGLWVKSDCQDMLQTALFSNKKSWEMSDAGIIIGAESNGSWSVYFTDGKNWQWDYKPTAKRQPINDGKWHYLAVAMQDDQQFIKMYYDGKNVATYFTNGNQNLATNNPCFVGNYIENQWYAFDGLLDQFTFTNRAKSAEEIADEYYQFTGKRQKNKLPKFTPELKMMVFNIFHGGHELGGKIGVQRVVDVIKASKADVIGMIETYGSGAEIADALGYNLYLSSSNLTIMSKYPIEKEWNMFQSFNTCAATIRISQTQKINYANVWLDYRPSTDEQVRTKVPVEQMVEEEKPTRYRELKAILEDMKPFFDDKENTPIFVSGDFNSGSHLDWTEETKHMFGGYVFPWPTSVLMEETGFKDSYREIYPDPLKYPCLTWSTMSKLDLQYRIDFIYYMGNKVQAVASEMIDKHPVLYPSDHASIVTTFKFTK